MPWTISRCLPTAPILPIYRLSPITRTPSPVAGRCSAWPFYRSGPRARPAWATVPTKARPTNAARRAPIAPRCQMPLSARSLAVLRGRGAVVMSAAVPQRRPLVQPRSAAAAAYPDTSAKESDVGALTGLFPRPSLKYARDASKLHQADRWPWQQRRAGIPSASSMPTAASPTSAPAPETTTVTQTTMVRGSPSLVIVTLTVTRTSSAEASTRTTTRVVTTASTGTESATGIPPWRPTGPSSATQSGCPTGFYGCLAVHGGGCCRTDRDCQTHSCPATTSTTVVAAGATVVVPAADVPTATTRGSCADGWSLCGDEAGPVAGCCPSGYSCGTASCFAGGATDTGGLQKALPASPSATSSAVGKSFASSSQLLPASGLVVGLALLLAMA